MFIMDPAIHRGIDVARAAGLDHIAAATGATSERAVQLLYDLHDLPDHALMDMGDFVGGMLKYLRRHPVERLTTDGGLLARVGGWQWNAC
jgi:cobalt-precorrin-5B (C1)-methyltransferase